MKIWFCKCTGGVNNAGDTVTPWLLDKMGLKWEYSMKPDLVGAGSILGMDSCKTAKIWGAGFHNEDDGIVQQDLSKYYAIRGKLSLAKLNTDKAICLGDSGILVSRFFDNANIKKEYKFGVIPHYIDYDFFKQFDSKEFHVIKIDNPNIEEVFEEINKCEFTLSSSLHGIIFSHSFGIPSFHIERNPLDSRGNFKFKDYYSSFGMKYTKLRIENEEEFDKEVFEQLFERARQDSTDFLPPKTAVDKMQKELLYNFPYKGHRLLRNYLFATKQRLRTPYRKLRKLKRLHI